MAANAFFDEFCRELSRSESDPSRSGTVDELLTEILEDELCSEVLFDAYRRVALTKSRNLGPRIIGILTAQLVTSGRIADDVEENILAAAENLADDELLEFAKYYRDQHREVARGSKDVAIDSRGGLRIMCYEESIDSNWTWMQGNEVSLAPLDLNQSVGRWAAKLKTYGIIGDDVKERTWDSPADSERIATEPGTVREISWWLFIPGCYVRLVEFVERVSRVTARLPRCKQMTGVTRSRMRTRTSRRPLLCSLGRGFLVLDDASSGQNRRTASRIACRRVEWDTDAAHRSVPCPFTTGLGSFRARFTTSICRGSRS